MRLNTEHEEYVHITLSERNLKTLLGMLNDPEQLAALHFGYGELNLSFSVTAEADTVHYAEREKVGDDRLIRAGLEAYARVGEDV